MIFRNNAYPNNNISQSLLTCSTFLHILIRIGDWIFGCLLKWRSSGFYIFHICLTSYSSVKADKKIIIAKVYIFSRSPFIYHPLNYRNSRHQLCELCLHLCSLVRLAIFCLHLSFAWALNRVCKWVYHHHHYDFTCLLLTSKTHYAIIGSDLNLS